MGQKQALLLATFLTTFGLIVIMGVALRLTSPIATPKGLLTESTVKAEFTTTGTDVVLQTPDPVIVEALIQSREAAYQQALAQANQQLESAYSQLNSVQQGVTTSEAIAPAAAPPLTYAITGEIAQNIALAVVPGATLHKAAEVVIFEGSSAYEVQTSGGVVYIEANTGKVLYNQATVLPVVIPSEQQAANFVPAPSIRDDDNDNHHEDEEREHDDDHEEEDD